MILVDTSAWIELFQGTEKGKKVKDLLTKDPPAYTSLISVAEIAQWTEKNNVNATALFTELERGSIYLELDAGLLKLAGKKYNELRKVKKNIGMIDAIIYTTACLHQLTLLTEDKDFEGLPNTHLI